MALKIITAQRLFILKRNSEKDNVPLEDPNPKMEVDAVMRFYSSQYPELTSSSVTGPKMIDDKAVYSFQTIIGDKG